MELKICHLYPDAMNLFGDRGNLIALRRRLEWRGIGAEILSVPVGGTAELSDCDIILLGDGTSIGREDPMERDLREKGPSLRAAAADGVTILAIGLGFWLLGSEIAAQDGNTRPGIDLLPLRTVTGGTKQIGDMTFSCPELGGRTVAAFECHDARVTLFEGLEPLGRMMHGFGNNGKDGTEGARLRNVFASNGHGPLLPKNPLLCDLLLSAALTRRYGAGELAPLDNGPEDLARNYIEGRLAQR